MSAATESAPGGDRSIPDAAHLSDLDDLSGVVHGGEAL